MVEPYFLRKQKMNKLKRNAAIQNTKIALLGISVAFALLATAITLKMPSKKIARVTAQRAMANDNAVFYKVLRGKELRETHKLCVICEGNQPIYVSVEKNQEKICYAREKPEGGFAGSGTRKENLELLYRGSRFCPIPKDVPAAHEGQQTLMKEMNKVLRAVAPLKPIKPKKKGPEGLLKGLFS